MARRRLVVAALGTSAAVLAGFAAVAAAPPASATTAAPGTYRAVAPTRLLDTRMTAAVAAGQSVAVAVAGQAGVPTGVSAVVLNVTATGGTASGSVTAYADGAPVPATSNLNFGKGQTLPNQVVAPVGSDGKFALRNNASTGTVQLIADLFGYFEPGAPADAGTFGAVAPARLLDTRSSTPVAAGHSVTVTVAGAAGIPAGVSAVVLNVTATGGTASGSVTAYADGAAVPPTSNLNFGKGQTLPASVVAPVGSDGKVALRNNASTGSVQLIADVFGYYLAGSPVDAGGLGAVAPARLLDTRNSTAVAAGHSVAVAVAGQAGIPLGVSAVVLNVTATAGTASGSVTAYADGAAVPSTSNLNFGRGQTLPNLVVAPVGSDGKVALRNNASSGSVQLIADVFGFYLSSNVPVPPASPSRYVSNLTGTDTSADTATMNTEGCDDAHANASGGRHLMLLDIGAQTVTSPLSATNPGVALTHTDPVVRIAYPDLVTDIEGYLDGYARCKAASDTPTVAVGTNNDGDFNAYAADQRGVDWASKVIEPLVAHAAGSGITVVGADDIEVDFASTEAQAETWVQNYLENTSAQLVNNGSASGCPTTPGTTGQSCPADVDGVLKTWTQANYYALAHGLGPSQIVALPQIYYPNNAMQWANIDQTGATGSDHITFAGSLTSHAQCGDGCSLTPQQGFAALWNALSTDSRTLPASGTMTVASDLQLDN